MSSSLSTPNDLETKYLNYKTNLDLLHANLGSAKKSKLVNIIVDSNII